MTVERAERLGPDHRLRTDRHYAAVKQDGIAYRGRHCIMLVLARPGEPTRFGFIASRRGVGNAVQRNRARRRVREIVRRRMPRIPATGYWIAFICFRSVPRVPHQELASELEHLLAEAGALEPIIPDA